jgi:hypothetical protein
MRHEGQLVQMVLAAFFDTWTAHGNDPSSNVIASSPDTVSDTTPNVLNNALPHLVHEGLVEAPGEVVGRQQHSLHGGRVCAVEVACQLHHEAWQRGRVGERADVKDEEPGRGGGRRGGGGEGQPANKGAISRWGSHSAAPPRRGLIKLDSIAIW